MRQSPSFSYLFSFEIVYFALVLILLQSLFYGIGSPNLLVVVLFIVSAIPLDFLWNYIVNRFFLHQTLWCVGKQIFGTSIVVICAFGLLQMIFFGSYVTPLRVAGLTFAYYIIKRLWYSWQDSTLEVTIDFAFAILMNLGGQRLIYGSLATMEMMSTFSGVFLSLSYMRRLMTRSFFAGQVPKGQTQTRYQSMVEVTLDTILGFTISLILQFMFYGEAATLLKAGGMTAALYVLTTCRRYLIRRIFERIHMRRLRVVPGV